MGTDDPGYPADGESPAHEVEISAFRVGRYPVTVREFGQFISATSHISTAEEEGWSFVFGGLLPDNFDETRGVAGATWWRQVHGANWRQPFGQQSQAEDDHPVTHVSWYDAQKYCQWASEQANDTIRLLTEAEWEKAARGDLEGVHFPWGSEREPGGEHRMNVFQGVFPAENSGADGWKGTSPVGFYPPNGYGLCDVTGNVWEWCADWFDPNFYRNSPRSSPSGPTTGSARVIRGGSYLCHESYCWRYRVDARSSNTPESTTGNMGFRVALEMPNS